MNELDDMLAKMEKDLEDDDVRVNADAEVFDEPLITVVEHRNRMKNDLNDLLIWLVSKEHALRREEELRGELNSDE